MEYRQLFNGGLRIIDSQGRVVELTKEEVFELNGPVTENYNKSIQEAIKTLENNKRKQ